MLIQVSDVAEDEVRKLEKKFKEGNNVRVRILGYRHLEGLATGILKVAFLFHKVIYVFSNEMNVYCLTCTAVIYFSWEQTGLLSICIEVICSYLLTKCICDIA